MGIESENTSSLKKLSQEKLKFILLSYSMNVYRIGTYLIPLESWEGAEHCPSDRIGIDSLAGAESHFEY